MKKIIVAFGVAVAIVTLFTSCSMFDEPDEYNIDPQLKVFTEQFFQEAYDRNIHLSKTGLVIVQVSNIKQKGLYFKKSKTIQMNYEFIQKHLNFKTKADTNLVKLSIWHEMGHWLGKPHRDGLSIMNAGDPFEGNGDFIGTVQTFNGFPEKQLSIIDELFLNRE